MLHKNSFQFLIGRTIADYFYFRYFRVFFSLVSSFFQNRTPNPSILEITYMSDVLVGLFCSKSILGVSFPKFKIRQIWLVNKTSAYLVLVICTDFGS